MDFNGISIFLHKYENELQKRIDMDKYMTHTHPPTRTTVPNCLFCAKFGNVFATNITSCQNVFQFIKNIE